VVVSGGARLRARAALTRPAGHAGPPVVDGVLAAARLDGAALVRHLPPLREGGLLAALGRRLRAATVSLPPGSERAVRVTLAYADEGAARGAEARARVVVAVLAQSMRDPRDTPPWVAALSTATIRRIAEEVTIEAPLPERLIDALLKLNQPPSGL
jgi:hypothetical protein